MSTQLPSVRGRTIGITTTTVLQIFIGVILVFFGFILLASTQAVMGFSGQTPGTAYNVYTIVFGFVTTVSCRNLVLQKMGKTWHHPDVLVRDNR